MSVKNNDLVKNRIVKKLIVHKKVVAGIFLFNVFDGFKFIDSWTEIGRIAPKGDIQLFEKSVHSRE